MPALTLPDPATPASTFQALADGDAWSGHDPLVLKVQEGAWVDCATIAFLACWGHAQKTSGRKVILVGDAGFLGRMHLHKALGIQPPGMNKRDERGPPPTRRAGATAWPAPSRSPATTMALPWSGARTPSTPFVTATTRGSRRSPASPAPGWPSSSPPASRCAWRTPGSPKSWASPCWKTGKVRTPRCCGWRTNAPRPWRAAAPGVWSRSWRSTAANTAGYRYFQSVEEFQRYVTEEIRPGVESDA